ncbi:hypothetical protein, partial [Burkholderia pseudomallei]|uniref:hypothetical protein n=1 Tax=Burkholderia pseudomallei TaxID=28450 RepID=UPI001C4C5669
HCVTIARSPIWQRSSAMAHLRTDERGNRGQCRAGCVERVLIRAGRCRVAQCCADDGSNEVGLLPGMGVRGPAH